MADPVVRLTVNVSPAVAAALEELATDLMKTNKTQALNQAITTTAAIYKAQAAGGEVVVKEGKTERPVNLPTAK
jgi:predicted transcriptional regulator